MEQPHRDAAMKALCGAWALSGEPVEKLLSEQERAAIIKVAGGESGCFEELISGPLWMAAAPVKIARRASVCAGMEGFIASGPDSATALDGLLGRFERDTEFEPRCAGHCVLAFADMGRGRLSLFRDFSGCERLYFTRVRGLLLFSSSVRPLLAHPAVPRAVEPDTILEFALLGVTLFGDATPFAGIREVLPGHRLDVSREGLSHHWYWGQSFEPVEGDPKTLGYRLWEGLLESVSSALGTDRKAAISLSGGIDSASVAAALAEVLGPDRVHAFTYEIAGSPHPSEAPLAGLVCRRLGIKRHTICKISFAEHSKALPESIWLNESTWRMQSNHLLTARLVASHGYSQYFSGCGCGGHMNYLRELAGAWLAAPTLMSLYWSRAIARRFYGRRLLSAMHPALDTRFIRDSFFYYFPILCVLRHNGILDSLSGFYPEPLGSMADKLSLQPRIKEALAQTREWPLAAQMQFHSYIHLNSLPDAKGRTVRISRLAGARQVLPYLFPRCLFLASMPLRARSPFWDSRRRLPPGKFTLREAVRDRLPREVVFRRKIAGQSVAPSAWSISIVRRLEPHLAASVQSLKPIFGGHYDELRRFPGPSLLEQALWHSLLIERPPRPTWDGLYGSSV
ncbi:MAG: asparagine synthase-related protein [bacterium]